MEGPPSWLKKQDRGRDNARVAVYSHDILLSNGWEVFLKFRNFKLSQPEALLPPPSLVEAEPEETVPPSA